MAKAKSPPLQGGPMVRAERRTRACYRSAKAMPIDAERFRGASSNMTKWMNILCALVAVVAGIAEMWAQVTTPVPCGPVPSSNQLRWQQMEMYAFIHYSINTYTDQEWGYGDESPTLFIPSDLDCRQWAKVCKQAELLMLTSFVSRTMITSYPRFSSSSWSLRATCNVSSYSARSEEHTSELQSLY